MIALWCFTAVGCAQVLNAPATDAISAGEPTPAAATPEPVDTAVIPEPVFAAPAAAIADSTADFIGEEVPVAVEPEAGLPPVSPAEVEPDASELVAVAPAAQAEVLEPGPSVAPPVVASATSLETLDFSSLVTRLRKTKAISLRTKVAVKNESDDLLEQARAYHAQTGETTLAELRRSYDSLFQELHSLLEDADPPLARDIDRSRAAIWEILADPRRFNAAI